jgi:hypothetical protein
MKQFCAITILFFLASFAYSQVDSSYFVNINGFFYTNSVSYDADGKLVSSHLDIVANGDTASVTQKAFADPINFAQEWAVYSANAVNMRVSFMQLQEAYGTLWEQITGKDYLIERANFFKETFFNGGAPKVRLTIFGAKYADFGIVQLANGRLRLNGIDDPATPAINESTYQYLFHPKGNNVVQIMGLPASDAALSVSKLNALKVSNPGLSTQIDAVIAGLSTPASALNDNTFLFFVGKANKSGAAKFES